MSQESPHESSVDGEWPQFRNDILRSGCVNSNAPPVYPTTKWLYKTGGSIWSSPVVAEGLVLVGSDDHHLHAVDATTGEQVWRYETGSEILSTPAVHEGTVFFGSTDRNVYAVDAHTGDREWTYETDGIVISSPLVKQGTVFVGGNCQNLECERNYSAPKRDHGVLHAIDAATGDTKWQYRTGDGIMSSPAVDGNTLYVGSSDGAVHAVDTRDGRRRWRYPTDAIVQSTPAVAGGAVCVGDWNGVVHSIDAERGERNWAVKTEGNYISGSAAACDDTVYIGVVGIPNVSTPDDRGIREKYFRGTLFAYDVERGEKRWSFATDSPEIGSSPAVTDSAVVLGSHAQGATHPAGLYAVERDTGTERWMYRIPGEGVGSSPAVVPGAIFVGGVNGFLYAFEAIT